MKTREDLSKILHEVRENVYFQPGSNVTMKYPCIVYEYDGPRDSYANGRRYITFSRYTITDIYQKVGSRAFDKLREAFPNNFSWDRQFKSDNLYHDVYTLYF